MLTIDRIAFAAALIAVAVPTSAQRSDQDTGNDLLARCEGDLMSVTGGSCMGQVIGAMNAIGFAQALGGPDLICRPARTTNGQAIDVVRKWLRENPGRRHLESTVVIVLALSETWPCGSGPLQIDPQSGQIKRPPLAE